MTTVEKESLEKEKENIVQGKRIFVVDAEKDILKVMKTVLEEEGAEVDQAKNSQEALEIISTLERMHKDLPDLVIIDIIMPQVNGIEFIKKLRAIPGCEKMPIILASGPENEIKRIAREVGADAGIEKPFDIYKLVDTVKTVLKTRKNN